MRILITGITGTLGKELLKRLVNDFEIIGYSRCEYKQACLPYHKNLTLYVGDIRDRWRLIEASRACDLIIHTAALKRVETLEAQPDEAIKTNINGTENVLKAQRIHNISKVVLVSTDKAVYPINAYGMSKAIAERLTLRDHKNAVVRYANVLASRGSVIPMFVDQLRKNGCVHITHPDMTRMWITLDTAASFVVSVALGSSTGLHIPKLKAAKIMDVASVVATLMGIKDYKTAFIGKRPGEKLHETMVASHEGDLMTSQNCEPYSRQELLEIIRPLVK